MTNDHAPVELPPTPDHPATNAHDRVQQVSGRRVRKIIRTLLKGWRALVFLLIVLVVGSYAFYYKTLSDPGSESKQLANYAPQEIDFFVSNPNVSIDVDAEIEPASSDFVYDTVIVSAHAPSYVKSVTILVLSNSSSPTTFTLRGLNEPIAFFHPEAVPSSLATRPQEQQSIDGYFALITSIHPGTDLTLPPFLITTDLEQTGAYLYGHLPAVGPIDQWANTAPQSVPGFPHFPAVLAESYKNSAHRVRDILLNPVLTVFSFDSSAISNPKSYRTPYGGPGKLFWTPAKLSIAETQSNLAATIVNEQINYMTPTGQASGPSYTWQGSTYLEPVFQVTNGDALQSESNYAFLSGVLFGIAGAATIAFTQEIPETFSRPVWWSRRKRKRKSSSQNATGTRVINEGRTPTGLGWPRSN